MIFSLSLSPFFPLSLPSVCVFFSYSPTFLLSSPFLPSRPRKEGHNQERTAVEGRERNRERGGCEGRQGAPPCQRARAPARVYRGPPVQAQWPKLWLLPRPSLSDNKPTLQDGDLIFFVRILESINSLTRGLDMLFLLMFLVAVFLFVAFLPLSPPPFLSFFRRVVLKRKRVFPFPSSSARAYLVHTHTNKRLFFSLSFFFLFCLMRWMQKSPESLFSSR